MGNYLCCCFGCCSSNAQEEKNSLEVKSKMNESAKVKNLKDLQKINRNENFGDNLRKMSSGVDPTSANLEEQILTIKIPNKKYGTVDEFIAAQGYKLGYHLGQGRFGKVFSAQHIESGLKLAVKQIEWSKDSRDSALRSIPRELYTLQRTKHPNLIKMVKSFIVIQKNMSLYLFLQYAPNGTLAQCVKDNFPFEERRCRVWFSQLLSGLNFLHNKGIAHRDLKMDNILLDEVYDILISDFGLSNVVFQPRTGGLIESATYCGTVQYMPPELLIKKTEKEKSKYNAFLVDVWSLAVILCKILTNEPPYKVDDKTSMTVILKNIKLKKFDVLFQVKIDRKKPEIKTLIQDMLESNPQLRPTMKRLTEYQWINETYREVEAKNMTLIEETI